MTNTEHLVEQALTGDQRAISRLATRLENSTKDTHVVAASLAAASGRAHVLGITGAPGVGKSSLLSGLAREISDRERKIAIIAVDPSSPRTGGATLGDRIRMSEMALDSNVFVRSLASRDRSDGLAPAVADLVLLFDAAGYDYVAVETVGAGQDQLEIADLVHTTVLLQIPGAGDSVQLLKAGAMEIADVYVVNKADLPGAQQVSRDLRSFLSLSPADESNWDPPIVLTSSTEGTGFKQLLDRIDQHHDYLSQRELLGARQQRIARSELKRAIEHRTQLPASGRSERVDTLVEALVERTISPDAAAKCLLEGAAYDFDER